jgi:Rad3-related DNA helicase
MQKGPQPFMEYQLPRAVINVKQGAGRLIRTERDKGVLAICDPRMLTKPYGKRVWQSLPPMTRSRSRRKSSPSSKTCRRRPAALTVCGGEFIRP